MTLSSDQDEQQFRPEDAVSSHIAAVEPDAQSITDSMLPVQDEVVAAPVVDIEDLTLAEAFAQMLHAPAYTLRSLRQVISAPNEAPMREVGGFSAQRPAAWRPLRNVSTTNPNRLSDAGACSI